MKLLYFILVVFMLGCSDNETLTYSCDPSVDRWVKEHLVEIQSYKRSDWFKLKEEYKKGVYNAFSKDQMQIFWIERMDEVANLEWSETERIHIMKLRDMIIDNPDWFCEDINDDIRNEIRTATYSWYIEGQERFQWNKYLIASILAAGNKMIDTNGQLEHNKSFSSMMKSSSKEELCSCSKESDWCLDLTTTTYTDKCKDASCVKVTNGCGTFWSHPCNGICQPF